MGASDTATWNLFCDWCTALELSPLPAEPLTLARFLDAHPAAAGTQRRRVSAINAAHRRRSHTPPGTAGTVREYLGSTRAAAARRNLPHTTAALLRLPDTGWPTALFTYRDALILVLSTSAIPHTHLAALRTGDVSADGAALRITAGTAEFRTPAELAGLGVDAGAALDDWLHLRAVIHQLPSARWAAAAIAGAALPPLRPLPPDIPLFTPLDRWGAAPLPAAPLAPAAVSAIVSGHLSNTAPAHRPTKPPRWRGPIRPLELPEPEPVNVVPLDPDSFARGVDARRRAAHTLDGVTETLDDVEDRAEKLLADLLEILDG